MLDMNVPIIDPDAKEDRKKILVDYFSTNRHNHQFYAYRRDQMPQLHANIVQFANFTYNLILFGERNFFYT
jgi:hypothetical protein